MKKFFLTLLMALVAVVTFAYDVKVDGIYYNLVSKAKTAAVTRGNYSGSVVIPEQITVDGTTYSVTSIGESAFDGSSGLTSVTIPNSVTSIGWGAFWLCSGLTSVTIPNSVTSIGNFAFAFCSGLTSVEIPNSVTSIGWYAFRDCSGLTSVTIPNSVTSIGDYAFYKCSGLTSVTIPNSVTSIGYEAFYCCSGLKNLTLGSGLRTVWNGAFASCKNLEEVICYAEDVPSTSSDAFKDSYVEYATLIVPDASIEKYKVADQWKDFGTIKGLSGNTPEVQVCEKPIITFKDNHIKYYIATEGSQVVGEIKCEDNIKTNDLDVPLTGVYHITAYATKPGYEDSEVATATLVWLNATLEADAIDAPEIRVATRPVLVSGDNGVVTVSGLADGEKVELYTTDGRLVNTTKAFGDTATCAAQTGVMIVKVGQQTVKVLVK